MLTMIWRAFSLFPLFLVLFPVLPGYGWAEEGFETALASLKTSWPHQVKTVINSQEVLLDDGRRVRLIGLARWDKADPYGQEAQAALETLVAEGPVRVFLDAQETDRYGRLLAHLQTAQGRWVQAELVGAGLARVQSYKNTASLIPALLKIEANARLAKRGLWADAHHTPLKAEEDLSALLNGFVLVEGRVRRVAKVGGTTYLNFGENWREDFTVMVKGRDRRAFSKAGLDLHSLEGALVRVRGWMRDYNGPLIEITHPETLEVFP